MLLWMTEATCVASALALVAFVIGRLRSTGPAVRHALWLIVLIKLVIPPVIAWPWASVWSMPGGPPAIEQKPRKFEWTARALTMIEHRRRNID